MQAKKNHESFSINEQLNSEKQKGVLKAGSFEVIPSPSARPAHST